MIEFFKKKAVHFDIDIDDNQIFLKDMKTNFIWLYNGKFGGGSMLLSPFSIINDGFCELSYYTGNIPMHKSIGFFAKVKAGGE